MTNPDLPPPLAVDEARLARWRTRFLKDADETLAQMALAAGESGGGLVSIGRLAHRLKSSAALLGHGVIANLCASIELAAVEFNDALVVSRLVAELRVRVAEVAAEGDGAVPLTGRVPARST
jgi:HPt (histidine-containing phosphotransfer) domain-containing protein